MMDYRENAGYLITDSCHVGDSEFVLGVHLTEPHQFVTWKCTNQTDYYWGHYFSDLFSAQKDFVARAQEEVQYLEEQRQNPVRLKAPGYSPWGEVQTCETLCPGAYSVSTAGHGGVLRELMDKKLYQAPVNQYFGPGEYEKVIDRSLRCYHPEYWKVREKAMEGKNRQTKQRDKGNDR